MLLNVIFLVIGLMGVVKAADWFLGSAETIGVRLGLSSFVLGVLLVGFGTSLPELATSVAALAGGTHDLTIANIVGSNLANILLIIGLSTFVLGTITFEKDLIDLDLPLLFGVGILFSIFISDGSLVATEGILLLVGFTGYVIYTAFYKEEKAYHRGLLGVIATLARDTDPRGKKKPEVSSNLALAIAIMLGSIVLLAVGSKLAVDNLLEIVQRVDVNVAVLTFFTIAIGTSLPELTVSFKLLRQGKGDIMVGDIIGSSIFNMLLVGGVASILQPQHISTDLIIWSVAGLVISILMLVLSGITKRIHVWEGLMYLLIYTAIASQILK